VEGRIIPICKQFARISVAALAASCAFAAPAAAVDGRSGVADYARARAADASGELQVAARGYAAALAQAPFNETLAARAYRRAVAVGDRSLALRAAQSLQQAGALPPDGEFLFLIEALDGRDWSEARRVVDRIEAQELFASLAPVLRAWIAFAAQDEDPFALLDSPIEGAIAPAYTDEHRALLLLATGRYDDGVAALTALRGVGPARLLRLRLAAAATLAGARRRDQALTLVQGEGQALEIARAQIERRRRLTGAVETASQGVAEIFIRLAADVNRRNVSELAVTLARYATFLAPGNSVAWLVTSAILETDEQNNAAIGALDRIPAGDPFYSEAQDARVRLLAETDNREAALALAAQRVEARGAGAADWQRYGELFSQLGRFDEAAGAYREAIDRAGGDAAPWTAWLLYGGALHDAGRWDDARPVLDRAVELAPDQPLALNFLGYALLERREDLARAETLIARASELQPESASITDSLGWVYYVQGDVERAIPVLERAALGDPDEPTINEHLGDAYWVAGRRREARFAWQAAIVAAEDEALERLNEKLDLGLSAQTASP